MRPKIKNLYKHGLADKQFIDDIKKADNDTPPGLLSNELLKHIFAVTYYGWLVGKYGPRDWDKHLF